MRIRIVDSFIFIAVLLLFGIVSAFHSYAAEKRVFGRCDQDCAKCHTLSNDEVKNLIKDIIPYIEDTRIRMSSSLGLWEVFIRSKARDDIVYIDFSKQNMILGHIVDIKSKKDLTNERLTDLKRVDFSSISLDNAIVMGNPEASHKIVVFEDPT